MFNVRRYRIHSAIQIKVKVQYGCIKSCAPIFAKRTVNQSKERNNDKRRRKKETKTEETREGGVNFSSKV